MILPPASGLPFLSPNFGSHMVLQREKPNPIWGWTTPGAEVTVTVLKGRVPSRTRTKAGSDGKWLVRLAPPPVGGPYRILVDGPQHVELEDVLVGDVWVLGGQSNMEFGLTMAKDGAAEVAAADRPKMRLFMAPRQVAYAPQAVNGGEWKVCTPKTVAEGGWGGFSAVGYFFGKRVQEATKVPVGLVEDCWGGTSAEAWTTASGVRSVGDFDPQLMMLDRRREEGGPIFGTYTNLFLDGYDRGRREGWQAADYDDSAWTRVAVPGAISPVPPRGAVWFRRVVDVPAGGPATLVLNRIDDTDTTWVNGELAGNTSFDWAWRRYPVNLKPGRNVIAVRAFTSGKPEVFLGRPDEIELELANGTRVPLAGEWRTKVGLDRREVAQHPQDAEPNPTVPTVLFNGMIAPLAPLAIKGIVWYQGETNAGRGVQYRRLLPTMVEDWRQAFGQGDVPFYIVSLANFMPSDPNPGDDNWAELRDAQAYAARTLPNSGLAVTIDVGEADDVHPKDKRTVGDRLAAIALAKSYKKNVPYAGPSLRAMKVQGDAVRLTFDSADGLAFRGEPAGFAVAGDDHRWHWAQARVEGKAVVVRSAEVPHPVAVRYAWGHNPAATLYNGAGFPAVPFRTDDWPLLSENAR